MPDRRDEVDPGGEIQFMPHGYVSVQARDAFLEVYEAETS